MRHGTCLAVIEEGGIFYSTTASSIYIGVCVFVCVFKCCVRVSSSRMFGLVCVFIYIQT